MADSQPPLDQLAEECVGEFNSANINSVMNQYFYSMVHQLRLLSKYLDEPHDEGRPGPNASQRARIVTRLAQISKASNAARVVEHLHQVFQDVNAIPSYKSLPHVRPYYDIHEFTTLEDKQRKYLCSMVIEETAKLEEKINAAMEQVNIRAQIESEFSQVDEGESSASIEDGLREKLKTAIVLLSSRRKQCAKQSEQLQLAEDEIKLKNKTIEQLRNQLIEATKQLTVRNEELINGQREIERQSIELAKSRKDHQEAKAATESIIEDLRRELAEEKEKNRKLLRQSGPIFPVGSCELTKQLKTTKSLLAESKRHNEIYKKQLEELTQEFEELEKQRGAFQAECTELKKSIQADSTQNDTPQSSVQVAEKGCNTESPLEVQANNTQLQEKFLKLKKRSLAHKQKWIECFQLLKGEKEKVSILETDCSDLLCQLNSKNNECSDLIELVKSLQK